jgi:hypothetical protein
MIRIFDAINGKWRIEFGFFVELTNKIAQISGSIAAHARCINAIDCNDEGLVVSVSDDCYIRIWKLSGDAENLQVDFCWFGMREIFCF